LLSIAIFVQPKIVVAADAVGGDDNTAGASGAVILRGTRPVTPTPPTSPKAANERNRTAAPNMGFLPAPLSGSGWDTGYSTEGLSYTPGVTQ
jgi:hypothetical protein